MPPNRVMEVEAAWPKISKALADGLEEPKKGGLADYVSVTDRPGDLSGHVTLRWVPFGLDAAGRPPPARFGAHRLTAWAAPVFELRARRILDRNALRPAIGADDLARLGKWATATRARERQWVLQQVVRAAGLSSGSLKPKALKRMRDRHADLRIVAFKKHGGLSKVCEELDVPLRRAERKGTRESSAVVVYPGDQLAVARLEDLTPSWDLAPGGVEISITGRLLLLGFDAPPGQVRWFRGTEGFTS